MSHMDVNISEIFAETRRTLGESIDLVATLLPSQGPIKEFIHHNTLHGFQHLNLGAAIAQSRWLFGVRVDHLFEETSGKRWATSLDEVCGGAGVLTRGIRSARNVKYGYNVDADLIPLMIKLTSGYYDQGLALWPHPSTKLESSSIWTVTQDLIKSSFIPLVPFESSSAKHLFDLSAENALEAALIKLCPDYVQRTRYLAEFLMILPGWAGFVHEVERDPSPMTHIRPSRLIDWLALGLVAELGFIEKSCSIMLTSCEASDARAGARVKLPDPTVFNLAGSQLENELTTREWGVYDSILDQIPKRPFEASQRASDSRNESPADWQIITCIDDRNFAFRGFIEKIWPGVETYGAPGFFSVDAVMQSGQGEKPVKYCPAPVTPSSLLIVKRDSEGRRQRIWERESAGVIKSWIAPQLLGIPSAIKLMLGTIVPEWIERTRIHSDDLEVSINPFSTGGAVSQWKAGYTIEESATRVGNLLRTIGLSAGMAPYIAVIGHGSSSANNPYFAAYDCGACSGRPGALNAFAFCEMANNQDVRALLRTQGFVMPDSTRFVPFIHDTAADTISRVGKKSFVGKDAFELEKFQTHMSRALALNAQFRCRQFALVSENISSVHASKHVARRSVAWFEPRPEYNHATNIACIVGRRQLSKDLQSSRAIFLQSYDATYDPDGVLLTGVLGAVIPVCGGINLEYFFSRIDSDWFGAGSKLPHNVAGLNGVMTGIESDLRTGLPKQMTEIHDPLRLLIVVEHFPDVVLKCISKLSHLRSWVDQRWVWLVSHNPESGAQLVYQKGNFVTKDAIKCL